MSTVLLLVPQRFLMFKMLYLVALKKVIELILKFAVVLPFCCGIWAINSVPLEIYLGGQKFTSNNPMEHLLDLFKLYGEAFEGQGR